MTGKGARAVWVLLVEVGYDMPDVYLYETEEAARARLMHEVAEHCEGNPDYDALETDDERVEWAHEHGGIVSTLECQEVLPGVAEEAEEEAEFVNPCSVCWEAEADVTEYAMCSPCFHNATRSGWTPGASL